MSRFAFGSHQTAVASPPASFVFNGTDEDMRAAIVSLSPNRKTFSISVWIKWSTLPPLAGDGIISMGINASNRLNCVGSVAFGDEGYAFLSEESDSINASSSTSDLNYTTNVWEHLIWTADTIDITEANRLGMYRNGNSLTISMGTPPVQNADLRFMVNGDNIVLGAFEAFTGRIAGKLAFLQVIEGAQITATDVGVDDGGTWKHKPYAGSYGTHGLYLPGTDGFNDVHRGLAFTPTNMDASNLDTADVPPYVSV